MARQRVNKLGWAVAAGVLALTLVTTSARANHEPDIVLPVITAFTLGALWNNGYSEHYYRHGHRHQGHERYRHGHHHKGHSYREQYSRGGYSQGPGYYGHDKGHGGHDKGHGPSRGGDHGPRRKH
jgi:hypothetical protein